MKNLRLSLILAALAAAAASQALIINYSGNGSNVAVGGQFTTTSLGYLGDSFNFASSVTTGALNQIQLFDGAGTSGLTLIYTTLYQSPDTNLLSATATATGFGVYAGLTGTGIGVVRNKISTYTISIQGTVNPVPEPASFAALGLGAVALVRRRRKA